jgi:steroid 5-alpha reductase family enzyme
VHTVSKNASDVQCRSRPRPPLRTAIGDHRYRDLLSRARGNRGACAFRAIYLTQALVLWLAMMPVQAGVFQPEPPGAVTFAGAALWLCGFGFESIGDWQLARFQGRSGPPGHDHGPRPVAVHPSPQLLRRRVHVVGRFLISLGGWASFATVFAPLVMTYVLVRGTGQRLTDQRMAQRPGYAGYAQRTSGFVPLPPRRAARHRDIRHTSRGR